MTGPNYQDMIRALQGYWAERGCVLWQPYHTEVGAGTLNPATFLRCLGPKPWRTAYVEPSHPPAGRPLRREPVPLPAVLAVPGDPQTGARGRPRPVLGSLEAIGVDLRKHDLRLVEDDWEAPTIGAWGLGWEVWLDGTEITQWTYFQQLATMDVELVPAEITYGLDRLAMAVQGKKSAFELEWAPGVTWGEIFKENERQWSVYNYEEAPVETLLRRFDEYESECRHLLERRLPLPAYDQVLKLSATFNLLEARGAIGVTERASRIARIRNLARAVAQVYLELEEGADADAAA